MSEAPLHLLKIPLRADRLVAIARRRGIRLSSLDDGYLTHCLLTELWQSRAPAPFVVRGRGRILDVWGYSRSDSAALIEHTRAFGDPEIMGAIDNIDAISSRTIPQFAAGCRVGFLLRACPVARLVNASNGHHAGAEVDVFLAKSFDPGRNSPVSREDVYREWLKDKLSDTAICGIRVVQVRIAALSRTRLVRRTQGAERKAATLERPDVRFDGDMIVEDGNAFVQLLARGVGRHKAFGFGAMLVVPPGTAYPNT